MAWFRRGSRVINGGRHRIWIEATPISSENIRRLVSMLVADGRPDAIETASLISTAHERQVYGVTLKPRQKEVVLAVLDDSAGELVELRGKLLRDVATQKAS